MNIVNEIILIGFALLFTFLVGGWMIAFGERQCRIGVAGLILVVAISLTIVLLEKSIEMNLFIKTHIFLTIVALYMLGFSIVFGDRHGNI